MTSFRVRYLWPVVLSTLCLAGLGAFTAVSLLQQQKSITEVLRENVESRRIAIELEEELTTLVALENASVEAVDVIHGRVRDHLNAVRAAADQPEERRWSEKLDAGFAAYLAGWKALPPAGAPGHDQARADATRVLEADVLRPCHELKLYNGRRLRDSVESQEAVLRQLAWGMVWVGGLGGVAGLVLGFGVARWLSRSIRRLQVRILDAAGKLDPALSEIVVTDQGDFPGLHTAVDQLTGRIEQVVADLQQREREVLRAEQLAAVGQLATGVAHEIRNPLTSIKMLVQAALEEDAGWLAGEDLEVIEAEVRRMERSLQTFLDFARPPKQEERQVPLGPLIDGVVGLIRGRADKQKVRVKADVPAGGVTVTADGERLRQVLVNLTLNALDAMPTGGDLTVAVRPRPAGRVEVEVADTGPGIAKAILPRLFEPFVSGKETGLGLGLVISKRIVEDHRGTIAAANRAGGGASFFVVLPAG